MIDLTIHELVLQRVVQDHLHVKNHLLHVYQKIVLYLDEHVHMLVGMNLLGMVRHVMIYDEKMNVDEYCVMVFVHLVLN